jgi:zinc protease
VSSLRIRPKEPPQIVARRLELKDPRAGNFLVQRYYQAPSYVTAKPGEAEALDLMMKIAGSGSTSRIYKKVVVENKLASSAGGDFSGDGLDGGSISLDGVAADGVPLAKVEAAIDDVLADVVKNGVTEAELARAKRGFLADYVYDSDNQATLARRYGWNLAVGRTVADIEGWPDAISKVTTADIKKVAAQYLDVHRSVTGYLIPDSAGVAQNDDLPPPSSNSTLR